MKKIKVNNSFCVIDSDNISEVLNALAEFSAPYIPSLSAQAILMVQRLSSITGETLKPDAERLVDKISEALTERLPVGFYFGKNPDNPYMYGVWVSKGYLKYANQKKAKRTDFLETPISNERIQGTDLLQNWNIPAVTSDDDIDAYFNDDPAQDILYNYDESWNNLNGDENGAGQPDNSWEDDWGFDEEDFE